MTTFMTWLTTCNIKIMPSHTMTKISVNNSLFICLTVIYMYGCKDIKILCWKELCQLTLSAWYFHAVNRHQFLYPPQRSKGGILESPCPSVRPSVCPSAFGFPAQNCFPFTPIIMKLHMQTPHESRMCRLPMSQGCAL